MPKTSNQFYLVPLLRPLCSGLSALASLLWPLCSGLSALASLLWPLYSGLSALAPLLLPRLGREPNGKSSRGKLWAIRNWAGIGRCGLCPAVTMLRA